MSRSRDEIDRMRAEMKRAVRYRSGPGMINTVYLGGMGTTQILRNLDRPGSRLSLQEAIDKASDCQIEAAYKCQAYQWILGHYRKSGSRLFEYTVTRNEVA